ncbi:hypothetical protein CP978_14040 [Streptomyces nodosus]|uniref:Uncharacterized protein n=1 Tax=Streptomyces nodosus TaxID=40318 RepID=A0A5P2W5B9_9ACTN|nr:hypothetical protein CP978_14040 [Streptomyces nodosus]
MRRPGPCPSCAMGHCYSRARGGTRGRCDGCARTTPVNGTATLAPHHGRAPRWPGDDRGQATHMVRRRTWPGRACRSRTPRPSRPPVRRPTRRG